MPEIMTVVSQAIGIVAMAVGVLSFQFRTQRGILAMQLLGSTLFALHFYLIGALSGALLNAIGIVRALIFLQRNRRAWAASPVWIYVFSALFLAEYALMFLVFGTPPTLKNFLLELLPVGGMIATTFSFRCRHARQVRLISSISSPLWLMYNAFHGSLGGVLVEIFNLISILLGFLRMDRRKKQTPDGVR